MPGGINPRTRLTCRAPDDRIEQHSLPLQLDVSQHDLVGIEQIIGDLGAISSAIAAAVTEQGAATQEIARSVDVAAKRTKETAEEVGLVSDATEHTRASVSLVKTVADELGDVAKRIRNQVDVFFERLRAA